MSTAKKAIASKKFSKKDIVKEVYAKLEIALLGFKDGLKKGGFEKSLKKASKSFAKNISRLSQKQDRRKKETIAKLKTVKKVKAKK
jgi:hypothetical protein